jgi:hypothetical protein
MSKIEYFMKNSHGMLRFEHCMRRPAILLLLLALSGCTFARLATTHFEKPTFTFVKSDLIDTSQNKATVNFYFTAHNPNKAGIKNAFISYELYVEEKRLLTGKDVHFDLNPAGDTEITVPAVIFYSDLFPVLGSVFERMLLGKKTVPITIHAVFSGRPAIYTSDGEEKPFTFDIPITKTVDVPLLRDKTNRGK